MNNEQPENQNRFKILIGLAILLLLLLILLLVQNRSKGVDPLPKFEPIKEEATKPDPNNTSEEGQESANTDNNSSSTDNYSQKADELYSQGDKEGALEAVNEGLKENPDDELLKSKKDTLEKEFYNDSEASGDRQ